MDLLSDQIGVTVEGGGGGEGEEEEGKE